MKITKIIAIMILLILFILIIFNIFIAFNPDDNFIERIKSTSKTDEFNLISYILDETPTKAFFSESIVNVFDYENLEFTKIKKSYDNTFYVLSQYSNNNYLFEIDESLNILKSFEIDRGNVYIYDFVKIENSFVFVGSKNNKPYLLKTSNDGDHLYSNSLNVDGRYNVIKSFDNDFIAAGRIIENSKSNAYISYFNKDGERIWDNIFVGQNNDEINDITININEIIAVGMTNSNPHRAYNVLILKYNIDGIRLYSGNYGYLTHNEYVHTAKIDIENYLYMGGFIEPVEKTNWRNFFVKTIENIEIEGEIKAEIRDVRGVSNLSRITEMIIHNERVYMIGYAIESWPIHNGFLKIINKNGYLIEQNIYGTTNSEKLNSFVINKNGELIIVGSQTKDNITYPLIIKTDNLYKVEF